MPERKSLDHDRYRNQLQALKTQLEADLQAFHEREVALAGGPGEPGHRWEHAGYGDHLADDATEVFEREKDLGLEQTLRDHLRQVNHALAKIADGTYGSCESCGKPIARARLDALPEATLCIDCKVAAERRASAARLPSPT
jgi:DnaK suppressor protein